jgi:hypothetical protein
LRAKAATSEALLEIEGQMLASRSSLGQRMQEVLPLNLSDTAATSQNVSFLEFIAAIVGRQCYIQDASGRGLWELVGGGSVDITKHNN